jgi:hypothetical protein
MLIFGQNIAEASTPLNRFVFWRLNANGTADPYALNVPVVRGNEANEAQQRPDIAIVSNRFRLVNGRPAFTLIVYQGADIQFGMPEARQLLQHARSNDPADYASFADLISEVFQIHKVRNNVMFLVTRRRPEFVFRGEATMTNGVLTLKTTGSERNGNSIANNPNFTFRYELQVGPDLDAPYCYLFKVEGAGGATAGAGNISWARGKLRLPTSIATNRRNAFANAADVGGTFGTTGISINVKNILDGMETLKLKPAGIERNVSVIYSGYRTNNNKEGIWTFEENLTDA